MENRRTEIAREHDVPVVESPPLARTLYRVVDVGKVIPPDMFRAVAELLACPSERGFGRTSTSRPAKSPAATAGGSGSRSTSGRAWAPSPRRRRRRVGRRPGAGRRRR